MTMSDPLFRPPRGFKPTTKVSWAKWLTEAPTFVTKKRKVKKRGAKWLGIKYEQRAQAHLEELYGERYIPSPWFKYFDNGDERLKWCQPDGLYIDVKRGLIVIVEIKLRHTPRAWWQLEKKYLPVLRYVFGTDFKYALVEYTKWYDGTEPYPVPVSLRPSLADAQPGDFQVTIWRPKGRAK